MTDVQVKYVGEWLVITPTSSREYDDHAFQVL
jgi:hypothetical protein